MVFEENDIQRMVFEDFGIIYLLRSYKVRKLTCLPCTVVQHTAAVVFMGRCTIHTPL